MGTIILNILILRFRYLLNCLHRLSTFIYPSLFFVFLKQEATTLNSKHFILLTNCHIDIRIFYIDVL